MLVLIGGFSTATAATETTVYYAVPAYLVNNGSYTVKLKVCIVNDTQSTEWIEKDMTYENKTYKGFRVYSVTFTDKKNGCFELQFQRYDGGTKKGEMVPISSYTLISVGTYNNKMYVHGANNEHKWITPTFDTESDKIHITYHVHKNKDEDWTPSYAYICTVAENFNNGWPGEPISANAFNEDWYDYVVNYSFDKIIFNNGNSGEGNQTDSITISNKTTDEYWIIYVAGETTIVDDRDHNPVGWIDYKRTGLTEGKFGTICLPYDATVTGATVYKIVSKTVDGSDNLTGINLEEVNSLEAGKAYIFKGTGSDLVATYSGSYTAATDANGMLGNLSSTAAAVPENNYIVKDNQIRKVVSGGSGVTVGQYKAYITLTGIDVAQARGIDFIAFNDGEQEQETDGINAVKLNAENDATYNLAGQRVSKDYKGIVIVNGKKIVNK